MNMSIYGYSRIAAITMIIALVINSASIGSGENNMSITEHNKTTNSHNHEHMNKANRLIDEKSPYLLQHAYNPVDWYPWGEEAFNKAKEEDKPIFLSIGYSTCHWCHVMERESFEDPEVAKAMNDAWISIKVDREERPDIDQIYMTVCQMMTGSGGWPLNVIMTPDKKPFFAGTYFPKKTVYGRIGMMDLTARVKELWTEQRETVMESVGKIMSALKQIPTDIPGPALEPTVMDKAFNELSQRFDTIYGGFSDSPKFPTPHNMTFLLRYWKRTSEYRALEMVEKTLKNMRMGGIYDHIGYGFHRYSTDREWLTPHFEKMLYDQALMTMVYTEAYQATANDRYKKVAEEIIEYVLRDMTDSQGGFYSAEDADSEGEEGKFYVWTKAELSEVLNEQEANVATQVFNVLPEGNYRDEATGKVTSANILHMKKSMDELAVQMNMDFEEFKLILEEARSKLYKIREKRVHPYKDDKVLTDWNGLMIAALAKAGSVFDEPRYIKAAQDASDFALEKMRDSQGRLLHRYREGVAGLAAHVDDYAFFIWGLLELYEAGFNVEYLKAAIELNEIFMDDFWDESAGGFFFTSEHGEDLLIRKKEVYDGATPSGNSVAALNLIRLGKMTRRHELEDKANKLFKAFSGTVSQFPSGFTQFLTALEFIFGQSMEVVIVGDPNGSDTKTMLRELQESFIPNKVTLFNPTETDNSAIVELARFTENQKSVGGKATAYVCRKYACESPTTDPKKMLELLGHKNP